MVKGAGPTKKPVIVKKRTKTFKRFHHERFKRLGDKWRRPTGIDNRQRRRYKGSAAMPKIGYGSNKKTKYMLANGLRKFQVTNAKDLELLLMHNQTYCAELAHKLSVKSRIELLKKAAELGVRVTNGNARLVKTDKQ